VREALGISPETEIDFIEDGGRFFIVKADKPNATVKFKIKTKAANNVLVWTFTTSDTC